MYYIRLTENQLIKALSSRSIYEHMIYKSPPQLDSDHFLVELKLYSYEIKQMISINKYSYILNKPLHFENRNLSILYQNEKQIENIYKLQDLYLEIKNMNNYSIRNITNLKLYNYTDTNNYIEEGNDSIYNYRLNKRNRFDRIKGAIYMLYCHYIDLELDLYNKYNIFDTEIKSLNSIINNIKEKNRIDKALYHSSNNLLKLLNKRNIENIKKSIYYNDFFYYIDYKLNFNYDLLNITYQEYIFILNIFDYMGNSNHKDLKIENVVLFSKSLSEDNSYCNTLKSDINILFKRVIEQDFTQNISNIKSDIVKNLFAFCIHFNNQHNLYSFLNSKNTNKQYISYVFYGAFWGYSRTSNSLVSDEYIYSDVNKSLLLKSISEADSLIFNLKTTMAYKRDRIHYSIIKLLNHYLVELTKNNSINSYILNHYQNDKLYDTLTITDNNTDFIVINFWKRKGRIAKSIKYFDNKTDRIKKLDKNLILKNDYVFSYSFIKNGKNISLDLLLEEKYMIILNDIEIYIKKEVIFYE